MEQMEIGRTGLKASVITFGAMGIGGGFRYPDTDDQESVRTLHAALDAGINLIDTAPVYGFGRSEEVIGKALRGKRDRAVISTKCGLWWGDDEGSYRFTWDGHQVKRNLSARTIRIEVEESLRRLQTDYIDIYYTHNPACPPFLTPIEETIDTLLDLKKEGKIRSIGASNCEPHHIGSYLERGELAIVQRRYNILSPEVEQEVLPLCAEQEVSFHAYSPLANGLLSGAYGRDYIVPPGDSREGDPWWEPVRYQRALDFVDELRQISGELQCSLSALAIAYLRAKSPGVNVICGIRKERHLQENVLGAQLKLAPDIVAAIDRARDAALETNR